MRMLLWCRRRISITRIVVVVLVLVGVINMTLALAGCVACGGQRTEAGVFCQSNDCVTTSSDYHSPQYCPEPLWNLTLH